MLSAAKHLLHLDENNQNRSFAPLRMTSPREFSSNLLGRGTGYLNLTFSVSGLGFDE